MAYRKKTLRKMSPKTREFASLLNDLELALNRLARKLPDIARLELDSQALFNARQYMSGKPAKQDKIDWDAINHGKDAEAMLKDQETQQPEIPTEPTEKKPRKRRTPKKNETPTEPLIPESETPESEVSPDAEPETEKETEPPTEPDEQSQE